MQGKVRYHGILGDWQWYRYKNVKFSSISYTTSSQSLATRVGFAATVGMCYGPKIILYELQTQAAL